MGLQSLSMPTQEALMKIIEEVSPRPGGPYIVHSDIDALLGTSRYR